jgi:hypothetical protein
MNRSSQWPHSNADAGIAAPGSHAISAAMEATGVRRIVVISASPVGTVAVRPATPLQASDQSIYDLEAVYVADIRGQLEIRILRACEGPTAFDRMLLSQVGEVSA